MDAVSPYFKRSMTEVNVSIIINYDLHTVAVNVSGQLIVIPMGRIVHAISDGPRNVMPAPPRH